MPKKLPVALSRYGTMSGDYKYILLGHYEKDRAYALNLLNRALPLFTDDKLSLFKMITQNEIYFFSSECLKQYQLGVKYSGPTKPIYSKAVGVCMYAITLLDKDNKVRGKYYAKLAFKEWNKLNKARDNKFRLNIYYMFTLALNNKYDQAQEIYKEISETEEFKSYPSYLIYLKGILVLIKLKL